MIYIGVQIVSGRGPIDFPIPCGKISLLPFTHSFQYFWSINMSLLWITMPTWFLHWLMSKIKSLTYICACTLSRFSHVQLFETPWTIARQAPLTMGFSRQEYWSGLPSPPPGDLPTPGIEPASLSSSAVAGRFFTTSAIWEAPLAKQNNQTKQSLRFVYLAEFLCGGLVWWFWCSFSVAPLQVVMPRGQRAFLVLVRVAFSMWLRRKFSATAAI